MMNPMNRWYFLAAVPAILTAVSIMAYPPPLPVIAGIAVVGQSIAKGLCQDGGVNVCTDPVYPSAVQYKNNLMTYPLSSASGSGVTFKPLNSGFMNFESPVIGATNQITFESPSQAWVGVADRNDVVSGAAYSTIKKGTSDYANWLFALGNATASATAAGYTFSMGAILCIHGEQDFLGGLPAATYQGDIVEWQSDMQTDIHNTIGQAGAIPFFVSQISQWWSGYIGTVPTTTGSASGARSVPLGQLDACRANIGVIYCSGPKYQFQYSVSPHFTNAGYLAMGERDGHAVKTVILDHQYWTGVQPRATTISGATIKARYWVQVAPLVIDTALVSNRGTGKGFEYWDDSGSPPPISSVSVSGDTVTITLASTPAGFTQQRLRYAYTAPGDPGMGNGARGNLRDSDTAMGRLSGAHLYNWAMHSDDPIPFIGPGYPLARRTSIGGRASVRGPAIIQ